MLPVRSLILSLLASAFALPASSIAADWPRWLGPKMDATWRETGITTDFDAQPPKALWRTDAGLGYAGPTVADGKVYVFDFLKKSGSITNKPSGRDKLEGEERVRCLDAETGEVLWTHSYPETYFISYPAGPRCVPTVADGKVYALGAEGKLPCLDAGDGTLIWSKDLKTDFGADTPIWGHSAHPLVHGDTLYLVGGGRDGVATALDKDTGEVKWHALQAVEPGYCPPSIIQQAGVEQLIIWHPQSLNALNPASGETYWTVDLKPSFGMSIMAPRQSGDYLFASGIGNAGALMKLGASEPGAEVVWRSTPKTGVYVSNSTPFIRDGVIYGADINTSQLIAVDLMSADRLWGTTKPTLAPDASSRARHGTAFLTLHEPSGHFFLFSENGDLILADLTREGYEELGRFAALKPTNEAFGRPVVWSAPAFALRSAFVRNDEEIVRIDLSAAAE